MLDLTVVVNTFLLSAGCAIAAFLGNAVRGTKLKRFTLAACSASLLSWFFYAMGVGHGPGAIVVFKPTVLLIFNMLSFYFKPNRSIGIEAYFLAMIPVFCFLAIFACFWWFSRWRLGEMDYFAD